MIVNPFEREHADAWATDFVDVESLNRRASDVVIERIRQVREATRSGQGSLRASAIVILGPAGAGKTHLFGRWRRAAGVEAAFVLIRPEIGVEPSPRHVLATVLDSLQRTSAGTSHRQLDIVVGSALAATRGEPVRFPNAVLDEWRQMPAEERDERLWACLEVIEEQHQGVDPVWIDRLLRTPFAGAIERRAAMTWLSGREPDELQLARLGLHNPLPDSSVMPALRSLAVVAGFGAPVVLVFDQLENLLGEEGEVHVRAHAQLVSELFDTVPGLVMVQMALDAEWDRRIRPLLSPSARTRVEATRIELELPSAAEREQLVRRWVDRLDAADRGGDFPAPFTDVQLRAWLTEPGMTPRRLMIACRDALAHRAASAEPTDAEAAAEPASAATEDMSLDERLELLWEAYVERARQEVEEAANEKRGVDRSRLRAALLVAMRLVGGAAVASASPRAHHDIVLGTGDGALRVYVLQQTHWRSVAAALERAIGGMPVRVVRERAFPIPPNWKKVGEQLTTLQAAQPEAFLEGDRNEIVQLLALHDLVAAARSQDLADPAGRPIAEAEVMAWVERSLVPRRWPIVRSALGLPVLAPEDAPATPPAGAPDVAAVVSPPTTPARSPTPMAAQGPVWIVLSRLRLASVARLLREVRTMDADLRRADVMGELAELGPRVRWFGRAIVAIAADDSAAAAGRTEWSS